MDLVERLKLLADETRLKIIELLLTKDLCVGAIAQRLGISDAAVSQHLQVLRKGGLVRGEKRGYWTHYTVEREALYEAAEQLKALADLSASRQFVCRRMSGSQTDAAKAKSVYDSRREGKVCKCDCMYPEKRKEGEKCSPEQIRECHGNVDTHPCESDEKKEENA